MSSQPPPPPPSEPDEPSGAPQERPPAGDPGPPAQERQSAPPPEADPGGPQQYGGQPGADQYGAAVGSGAPLPASEEKTWAVLAHLSAPIAALISAGMLNFVGPLVIWAVYKDRSPRVRHASAGAFNFNLSLWIVYAVLVISSIVSLGILLLVTVPVGITVFLISMVLHIMAAVKASNGEPYTYPLQIPVLK